LTFFPIVCPLRRNGLIDGQAFIRRYSPRIDAIFTLLPKLLCSPCQE